MKLISYTSLMLMFFFLSCQSPSGKEKKTDSLAKPNINKDHVESATVLNHETKVDDDTKQFIEEAAVSGMLEVELGKIAEKNAKSSKVREYGSLMVKDHTKIDAELEAIAIKCHVTISKDLSKEHAAHLDSMRKMQGEDFDKHYMDMMANDHQRTLEIFEKAAKGLRNIEVKKFAASTLPVVKTHLRAAQVLDKKIKQRSKSKL